MSETDALQGFLGKWEAQWPEWRVAEAFVPAAQRQRAQAWFALREELAEAAWGGEDSRPGEAKLGWWAEELDGWSEDISGCRSFDDLPKNTQAYVNRLEELCGARISGIGVGPGREQVVMLHDLL